MKLLFDANLSPKLASRLQLLFPGSKHVAEAGLDRTTADSVIWEFAAKNGFAIVTADSDFLALAESRGHPPHVIRLERCDYRTARVEDLLRKNAIRIGAMPQADRTVLIIRNQQ